MKNLELKKIAIIAGLVVTLVSGTACTAKSTTVQNEPKSSGVTTTESKPVVEKVEYSIDQIQNMYEAGAKENTEATEITDEEASRLLDIVNGKKTIKEADTNDHMQIVYLLLGELKQNSNQLSTYWADIQTTPENKASILKAIEDVNKANSTNDYVAVAQKVEQLIEQNPEYKNDSKTIESLIYANAVFNGLYSSNKPVYDSASMYYLTIGTYAGQTETKTK